MIEFKRIQHTNQFGFVQLQQLFNWFQLISIVWIWKHTWEPMAWQLRNYESPEMYLRVSMIEPVVDDAVQKAVLRSLQGMFRIDVSVRWRLISLLSSQTNLSTIYTEQNYLIRLKINRGGFRLLVRKVV